MLKSHFTSQILKESSSIHSRDSLNVRRLLELSHFPKLGQSQLIYVGISFSMPFKYNHNDYHNNIIKTLLPLHRQTTVLHCFNGYHSQHPTVLYFTWPINPNCQLDLQSTFLIVFQHIVNLTALLGAFMLYPQVSCRI